MKVSYQTQMSRNTKTFSEVTDFIRKLYQTEGFVPLHAPVFPGNEKKYLSECIDSTFVSSVGKFVGEVEEKFAQLVGAKYAVAVVNGTSALHLALKVAGVNEGDEVITQPLTFVATCNAIRYLGANPVFVDVSTETLGLSPQALENFLKNNTEIKGGELYNKGSGKKIAACLPMHTFGHPVQLDEIKELCDNYRLTLVEDAAEAVGSYYKGQHIGRHGIAAAFSFNGNKIITSGGGGMIVTNDEDFAKQAKHLSTVAKVKHPYEFFHDELGFNYRMPNINAAILLGQMERLKSFLENKRALSDKYADYFKNIEELDFFSEPEDCTSNYWLNAVLLKDKNARNEFLEISNSNGVMTRPAWKLMHRLPEFENCEVHSDENSRYLAERLVNIPSSVIL